MTIFKENSLSVNLTNTPNMKGYFIVLIWTVFAVLMNKQVLCEDCGDIDGELELNLIKTGLQQLSQGIGKIIEKGIRDINGTVKKNIVNGQKESIKHSSGQSVANDEKIIDLLSTIRTEQRLLNQKLGSLTTSLSWKEEKISDLRSKTSSEQKHLGQQIVSLQTDLVGKVKKIISDFKETTGEAMSVFKEKYPNTRGKDGLYSIITYLNKTKVVYCDMTTDNGGWTVIQRRVNGCVDFYRNWTEYKNGFGFSDHEFWIGNDMLHKLTSLKTQELRVDMERFNGEKAYAVYSRFSVGDETSKYKLEVQGYSGNAGDSLDYHNNMKFSTLDQDNDGYSGGNCATEYRSAGWFNRCYRANPNGQYADSEKTGAKYITWNHWKNSEISLKSIQLMIRPRA